MCTTEQLAQVYGADTNQLKNNFRNNKDRYKEGKHFILLQGEELNQVKNLGLVNKHTTTLYLWTERGAMLHAEKEFSHLLENPLSVVMIKYRLQPVVFYHGCN